MVTTVLEQGTAAPSLQQLRLEDVGNHAPTAGEPSEKTAAAKTARLFAEWSVLAPWVREAPLQRSSFVPPKNSAAQTTAAERLVPGMQQAAEKTRAMLSQWQAACARAARGEALTWNDDLQHQLSQQQGNQLLTAVSSLEYGR